MLKKKIISLEQQHDILYEILYMLDDFCKQHDISYFLIGGTLLGAVRHHGIIPWDDDADIGMTRENYEKFLLLFSQNTPLGYEMYSFYTNDWFDSPFIKVAKKGTLIKEIYFYHAPMAINIDILPFDGLGQDRVNALSFYQSINSKIRYKSLLFGSSPRFTCPDWKSKLLYYTTVFPFLFIPKIKKLYLSRTYRLAHKYPISQSEYCACIVNGLYGKGEVQPVSFATELTTLPLGSRDLPVPSGWQQYLENIYGDYMTPPPVDKRKRHSTTPPCLLEE